MAQYIITINSDHPPPTAGEILAGGVVTEVSMPVKSELVTVAQLADELKCSRGLVRDKCQHLPNMGTNGKFKFSRALAEQAMKQKKRKVGRKRAS